MVVNASKHCDLLKGILSLYSVTFSCLCLGDYSIRDQKCHNLYIRTIFLDRLHPNRLSRHYIFKDFDPKKLKEIRMSYLTFFNFSWSKRTSLQNNEYVHQNNSFGQNLILRKTLVNFVRLSTFSFNCNYSKLFWSRLNSKLSCIHVHVNPFSYKHVKFGVFKKDCKQHLLGFVKFFIDKCMFLKTPPSFSHFFKWV